VRIDETITIAAPPADVWAVLSDYEQDHRWRADVVEMIPTPSGPSRPGTTTHEVVRFLGSTYVTDATVTAVEETPDSRRLRFEGAGDGTVVVGERRVAEGPDGSAVVHTSLDVKMQGPMRLAQPLLGRVYARHVARDLEQLGALFAPVSV
jgi:carbon monoxide dehydrogenase subunit G